MSLRLNNADCIQIDNEQELRYVFKYLWFAKCGKLTVDEAIKTTTYPIYVYSLPGYGLSLITRKLMPMNVWTNKEYNILTLKEAINKNENTNNILRR